MTFEQQLLSALSTELQSFKDICLALGFQKPTQDMRSSMKSLIARNRVEQVGQKRGARYRLRAETVAAEEGASTEESTKTVSKVSSRASEAFRPAIPPKGGRVVEDAWVNPEEEAIILWELPEFSELHQWILDNWEAQAQMPQGGLELTKVLGALEDCPEKDLILLGRALDECVKMGRIRVRRQRREHDMMGHFQYCADWGVFDTVPVERLVERRHIEAR
jgi:hypothetical protein